MWFFMQSNIYFQVVEIIDHHKVSRPVKNATIEMVGSCTSLIMRKIWEISPVKSWCIDLYKFRAGIHSFVSSKQQFNDPFALNLTRWTILIDTNNLSKESKKATSVDVEILEKVEAKLSSDNSSRQERLLVEQ